MLLRGQGLMFRVEPVEPSCLGQELSILIYYWGIPNCWCRTGAGDSELQELPKLPKFGPWHVPHFDPSHPVGTPDLAKRVTFGKQRREPLAIGRHRIWANGVKRHQNLTTSLSKLANPVLLATSFGIAYQLRLFARHSRSTEIFSIISRAPGFPPINMGAWVHEDYTGNP